MTLKVDIYTRPPLKTQEGIPVFSVLNEYIDNYEKISEDHLLAIERDGVSNPFIDEKLWVELENSTIRLIRKYSKPSDTILDVGVSLGRLLCHFPSLQRYGMDISFGYLESAKKNGINVCYSLVEDMPYKEEMFDIVIATDVLEHVLDLNLACAKMLSVLKKGGVLIIRVPYREDLSQYLTPSCPYKYVHLRTFDETALRLLFERIFNCQCIDWAEAVRSVNTTSRLKYRMPRGDLTMAWLLNRIEASFPRVYRGLAPKLVHPIEINVVVRKQ